MPATIYSDPSVSRLRSHFRTPSVTTLNSTYSNGTGAAPASQNASQPPAWGSPSGFSALSRTSSSFDLEKTPAPALTAQSWNTSQIDSQTRTEAADSSKHDDIEDDASVNGEITGFVFHTMKDCTKTVFTSRGISAEETSESATTAPKAGFLRRWSGATATEEYEPSLHSEWGLPTVAAVNGLIAVGTENGWVVVMGFKQELRRICGTDAIGESPSYPEHNEEAV